jgi:polyhydroxyalkanoate synthesis regulator phasin
MGSGTLSVYTDTDREEFEDQSGMPGKGGNYKRGLKRHYVKKGGGKAMLGLPEGVIQEEEDLKKIIASIVAEMKGDADGAKAFSDEIMRSQEGDDDIDEEEDVDEQSLAGAVAGYTLPLGMSNRGPNQSPSWLAFAKSIGGTPVKVTGSRTLKVQRMNKTDKY